MLVHIDFSIFSSPTEAYGNVTGNLDVPDAIRKGDVISILMEGNDRFVKGFSGKLRVVSVDYLEGESRKMLIGLDDVVVDSLEDAKELVRQLQEAVGLFFDPYHY
jgi:hypothetical protein